MDDRGLDNGTFARYLESEVLSADPVKLVNLLYRGAVDATAAARRHLAAGEIGQRSQQILRVWDILQELSRSLDHERGAGISRQLVELYAYMQQRLLDANAQQADAPLAEVEALLTTLAEAWREVQAPPSVEDSAEIDYHPVSASY